MIMQYTFRIQSDDNEKSLHIQNDPIMRIVRQNDGYCLRSVHHDWF